MQKAWIKLNLSDLGGLRGPVAEQQRAHEKTCRSKATRQRREWGLHENKMKEQALYSGLFARAFELYLGSVDRKRRRILGDQCWPSLLAFTDDLPLQFAPRLERAFLGKRRRPVKQFDPGAHRNLQYIFLIGLRRNFLHIQPVHRL